MEATPPQPQPRVDLHLPIPVIRPAKMADTRTTRGSLAVANEEVKHVFYCAYFVAFAVKSVHIMQLDSATAADRPIVT